MANAPYDPRRPVSRRMAKAIEGGDVEVVKQCLTVLQKRFAEEYVADFNATAACIRAGYKPDNADKIGHQVLKHDGVAYYIDHLTRNKAESLISISPEYVIQQVTSIVMKEGAKDGDKLRGLELLARHLGMFIERTEITGKDGGAIEMNQRKIEEEANAVTNTLRQMTERQAPATPSTSETDRTIN